MASDHHLLLGTVRIKLKKYTDSANRPQQQYNVPELVLFFNGIVIGENIIGIFNYM